MPIGYNIRLGSMTVSDDARSTHATLLSLLCERSIGKIAHCAIELGAGSFAPPDIETLVDVALDDGHGAVPVFRGAVAEVRQEPGAVRITATCPLALLARLQVESAYEKASTDFIAGDLLGKAGLSPGQIAKGPTLPSYYLHRGSAFSHLLKLAERCGVEVYCDREGLVHMRPPGEGAADHAFRYGVDVLGLELSIVAPRYTGVVLYGEGSASAEGADKAHVLITDLASVRGEAGEAGDSALRVEDGAVRTGEDAASLAEARAGLLAARPIQGAVTLLPAPQLELGQRIELKDLPAAHVASGKTLLVRGLRHSLSLLRGFTTRVEV